MTLGVIACLGLLERKCACTLGRRRRLRWLQLLEMMRDEHLTIYIQVRTYTSNLFFFMLKVDKKLIHLKNEKLRLYTEE